MAKQIKIKSNLWGFAAEKRKGVWLRFEWIQSVEKCFKQWKQDVIGEKWLQTVENKELWKKRQEQRWTVKNKVEQQNKICKFWLRWMKLGSGILVCSDPPNAIYVWGWMKTWSGSESDWRYAPKMRGKGNVWSEFEVLWRRKRCVTNFLRV